MVREISKSRKIPIWAAVVVVFFMTIGIILILIGFYVLLSEWHSLTYLNLSYAELLLPTGAIITSLAVIGGIVITFRSKIISNTYIIIFVAIFLTGIILYLVGFDVYRSDWFPGGIPNVRIGNLVLISGSIAILDCISFTIALIYAMHKK